MNNTEENKANRYNNLCINFEEIDRPKIIEKRSL